MSQFPSRLSVFGAALITSACVVSGPLPSVTINTPGGGAGGSATASTAPATPKPSTPAAVATPDKGTSPAPKASTPAAGASAAPVANENEVVDKEPNDDFPQAQAVKPGQLIKGTTGGDTAGDTYKVTIPAGVHAGWLNFEVDEADTNWISTLDFYNANKDWLDSSGAENGTSQPWSKKWRVTPGASYYVRLKNTDYTSPYTIKTSFTPVVDPQEPNDDWASATRMELGKAYTFAYFWGQEKDRDDGDKDYFRVTLPAGKSSLWVNLVNKSTSAEPTNYTVTLYKSNKDYVDAEQGANNESNIEEQELASGLEAGDYYIVINGNQAASALSTVTITAE